MGSYFSSLPRQLPKGAKSVATWAAEWDSHITTSPDIESLPPFVLQSLSNAYYASKDETVWLLVCLDESDGFYIASALSGSVAAWQLHEKLAAMIANLVDTDMSFPTCPEERLHFSGVVDDKLFDCETGCGIFSTLGAHVFGDLRMSDSPTYRLSFFQLNRLHSTADFSVSGSLIRVSWADVDFTPSSLVSLIEIRLARDFMGQPWKSHICGIRRESLHGLISPLHQAKHPLKIPYAIVREIGDHKKMTNMFIRDGSCFSTILTLLKRMGTTFTVEKFSKGGHKRRILCEDATDEEILLMFDSNPMKLDHSYIVTLDKARKFLIQVDQVQVEFVMASTPLSNAPLLENRENKRRV